MVTIVTRAGKGSPLTHAEVDANFTNLNTDKFEAGATFNSASRAQTEAELIAGTNVTITPAGSGATRTLTIAASGGGGSGDVTAAAAFATDNRLIRSDGTGKGVQASVITLDDSGGMTFPTIATPTTPASGNMTVFGRLLGGRVLPAFVGPSGLDSTLQPHLGGNRVFQVAPTSGTGAPTVLGGNAAVAGTASSQQTFGSSNRWLSTFRKRYTTTATAGNAASTRQSYTNWMRGSAAGFGGFFFRAQFGININLNGSQMFVGLCPATGALGGDPSTDFALDMCGMGWDAADPDTGNWQFFRNDAAGSPVKVDLGATNAARAVDVGYELIMFMAPNGSELFVQITNLNTGADVLTTSYTTNIPTANSGMCLKADVRNGAINAACNIEWAKLYIEADY